MKKFITLLITIALIMSAPSYLLAESGSVLTWQKAQALLKSNSNVLKDLTEAEQRFRKHYEEAVETSKTIDTKGRTVYSWDRRSG